MSCELKVSAVIKESIQSVSSVSGIKSSASIVISSVSSSVSLSQNVKSISSKIKGSISSASKIINGGINESLCPIIFCIDGGSSSTVSFPSVNGLLNGGTA